MVWHLYESVAQFTKKSKHRKYQVYVARATRVSYNKKDKRKEIRITSKNILKTSKQHLKRIKSKSLKYFNHNTSYDLLKEKHNYKHIRQSDIAHNATYNPLICYVCQAEYDNETCRCNKRPPAENTAGAIDLSAFTGLPPGTSLPPHADGSENPLFEIRLKSGTLDVVNPDEVYGQIHKLNKLSANRLKDYLKALKKLHGEGCCCCICKAVKAKVTGEQYDVEERRKRECIEHKKKKMDLKIKSFAEWLMHIRRKKCTCGINPCKKQKEQMTESEIYRHRGSLVKPCFCGAKDCDKLFAKKWAWLKRYK